MAFRTRWVARGKRRSLLLKPKSRWQKRWKQDGFERQYGVTYTEGGAYSLMRRLQCSPKVPRPLHAKADEEQQASWKKGGLDLRLHRQG